MGILGGGSSRRLETTTWIRIDCREQAFTYFTNAAPVSGQSASPMYVKEGRGANLHVRLLNSCASGDFRPPAETPSGFSTTTVGSDRGDARKIQGDFTPTICFAPASFI